MTASTINKAGIDEYRQTLYIWMSFTTVNDLPNQFALTRLGKKAMWGGSHKVPSNQTLVKRPM